MPVNLDKKEFIDPHKLGTGLKLWEQLANHPGTGGALIILTSAMPDARGGGDFDLDKNWHGPERTLPKYNIEAAPMPNGYMEIAKRTIGRWAGDRIALIGDYAVDSDLPKKFKASEIWKKCHGEYRTVENDSQDNPNKAEWRNGQTGKWVHHIETKPPEYKDITEDVAKVIEHELNGKFKGDGWKEWVEDSN